MHSTPPSAALLGMTAGLEGIPHGYAATDERRAIMVPIKARNDILRGV